MVKISNKCFSALLYFGSIRTNGGQIDIAKNQVLESEYLKSDIYFYILTD